MLLSLVNCINVTGRFGSMYPHQTLESAIRLPDNYLNIRLNMKEIKVKIINDSNNPLPTYETLSSAGMDVRAKLDSPVTLEPLQRALIPTGLHIQLPQGYECQVRPRSGLALKHGITLVNTPGTIDADYRGEIGIIAINLSNTPYTISDGERIAQLVIKEYVHATWEAVDSLDETERGDGGFGHTGVK